jgi:hypothetical protein
MDQQEFEALKATVRELKDRQDILDCLVRESRGRDRHDVEMIASCYWPEGSDEHGPKPVPALDYPEVANAQHVDHFSANSHSLTNHTCDLQGDVAYCETYVVGGLLARDEKTCIIAPGRYLDQMERRNGEWRILYRRTIVDMMVEGPATWLETNILSGFLRGVRSKADTSYHRPYVARPGDPRWS